MCEEMNQQDAYIHTIADGGEEYARHEDVRSAYDECRTAAGRIDNVLSIHSINPDAMRAHNSMYLVSCRGASPLSRVEREIVAVAVSQANECQY